MINCVDCSLPYPTGHNPYRCPECNGLFDIADLPPFNTKRESIDPGIWRYRYSFPLPQEASPVYLGEGDTPLVWKSVFGKEIGFKLEFLNPTSSYKDRGTAILMSFLKLRGVQEAIDDSSGNAGASFAAYATFADMKARVFVPAYASGPKRNQIFAYGAEVIPVSGPRSNTANVVRKMADQGAVYASHSLLPHGLPGYATTAYEIVEQMGNTPNTVIVPIGQGNLILALGRAFRSMKRAGRIPKIPKLLGVQAKACAPIWTAYKEGLRAVAGVKEDESLAEGVRIIRPYRLESVIKIVKESKGDIVAVGEPEIKTGQIALANIGLFVEPTSAIVWNALEQVIDEMPDPIVIILTGSGLKSDIKIHG